METMEPFFKNRTTFVGMEDQSLASLKEVLFLADMSTRRTLLKPFLEALEHKDPLKRKAAIVALGKLSDLLSLEGLMDALEDEYPQVRDAAFDALNRFDHHGASTLMFNRIKSISPSAREKVFKILENGNWQPSTTNQFATMLVVMKNWDKITKLGKEAVEPLVKTLDDDNLDIRKNAVITLGKMDNTQALHALVDALENHAPVVRDNAYEMLCRFNHPNVIDHLLERINGAKLRTRRTLFEILDARGWQPKQKERLALYLVTMGKWRDVQAMGIDAFDALRHAAKETELESRVSAVSILATLKDFRALETLLIALKDSNPKVVEAARKSLVFIETPQAVNHLLPLLELDGFSAKDLVIEILGEIGDARALEPLVRLKLTSEENDGGNGDGLSRFRERFKKSILKIQSCSKDTDPHTICGNCLCRYRKYEFSTGFFKSYKYFACPQCGSNGYKEKGIQTIRLTLNHALKELLYRQGKTLIVNWYKRKEPCDYDEIYVETGSDFEIEELVLKLTNDNNEERRQKLRDIPLTLAPGLKLSQSKINLLTDQLKLSYMNK